MGDRLLVADLGVAKALLHASGLTQVVGTPSYMAPEQAAGMGVDVRADVHGLAAVTYQMLSGALVREAYCRGRWSREGAPSWHRGCSNCWCSWRRSARRTP